MNKVSILQVATMLILTATLISCRSNRVYDPYPQRSSVSLILNAGPGIMINRYADGRYYHRAPNGHIYWRGQNNRYYLDRRYVRPYQQHNQYNEWRRYNRRR